MHVTADLELDKLNEAQKNWYAIAICAAIIADGNIAPEELEYLEQAISFLPSQTQVKGLIDGVKKQKLPPLKPLKVAKDIETKMLLELTLVVSADNYLSTREMDYLFEIGKKLGFEKEYVRAVIRWSNEGILWRKKMEILFSAGMELEAEYD